MHNRSLIGLLPPAFPDWIVTVAFYSALHAVECLLNYDSGRGATTHDLRNTILRDVNRYAKIWQHYAPLYNLSRTVRYLAKPAEWIPYSNIAPHVLQRNLYPIEASVQRLTGQSFDLQPVVLSGL